MFWFHCGRCGSLFQAPLGEDENRLCAKCGFDPSPGIQETPAEPAPATVLPQPRDAPESSERKGKRSVKKRRNSHLMTKLIGGWLLLLAVIVVGARYLFHDEASERQGSEAAPPRDELQTSPEDLELLKEAGPKVGETFLGYVSTQSPEERNQFVLSPVSTASRMARFYGLNPIPKIDPQSLTLTGQAVLSLKDGKALETHWTSKDGNLYDAVFREQAGEWRLDWEHFARYSDYPWSLFIAGSGDPEGSFRLLARERTVDVRKDKDKTISLVLYAPRHGHPKDTGTQSPEFIVPRDSRDGRLLEAAFALARAGGQVFDSKLPNLNPDGMIRVNVNVKRTDTESGRAYEITRVNACHWMSVEDPGVEPAAAPEPPPATEENH